MPDALVGVDRAGVIRFVNDRAEELFGYDRDTLVGQLVEILVPKSSRMVHQAQREGYLAAPRTRSMGTDHDLFGVRRDGTEFPVDVSLSHVQTGEGLLVIAALRDMTARNKEEEARRQSDLLLASMRFSGDPIISATPDGIITSWNPSAERLFGYTSEEIIGQPGIVLSPKNLVDETGAVMARVRAGEVVDNLESFRVRKDGTVFPVSVTVAPIRNEAGAVIGTTAIPRDVTEQRRAFEAAQQMAAIIENSGEAIMGGTLDGIITSWNPAAERLFGYTRHEIVGQHGCLISPDGRAEVMHANMARISKGGQAERFEDTRVRKDGTEIPVWLTVSPICDRDGAVVGTSTIAHDLTEQKQAAQNAQSLSATQDLIQTMMTSASIGIALVGLDGYFTVVNTSMCELLGHDQEWLRAHRLQDFIHPDDAGEAARTRARFMADSSGTMIGQLRLVRSDGATLWVRRVASLIHGMGGQPDMLMVQVEDITAEHEAHEALVLIAADLTSQLEARVQLEGEVAARTADLQRVNKAMAETNRTLQLVSSGEQALIRATDEATLMQAICATIIETGDYCLAWVGKAENDEAQSVRPIGAAGDTAYLDEIEVSWGLGALGLGPSGQAIQTKTVQVLTDLQSATHYGPWRKTAADFGIASVCSLPIHAGTTFSGALSIYSRKPGAFDAASVALLGRLADDLSYGMGRLQDADRLVYQAFHDPLTGLHNRAWLLDILNADLQAAKRLGTSVAVLFVDLDNFKVVNDSLGHEAGDEVLTTLANRIRGSLRSEDRVGRFGGDEFVIVVQDVADVLEVESFTERVSAAIASELQVRGHAIVPTASIGIAVSNSTSTPESLLRDADSAMFRAKAAGRASWQFFDEMMHGKALARLTVEGQLREAIIRSQFVVYYQPIVALADSHVVGHEALVRWAHPSRGLLSPGEFLDVAEDTGLIGAIGAQVLDQCCAMLAERPDLPGPVSVNVSAVQLSSADWLRSVTDTLTVHRVDPARLVIEITETAALAMTDSALHALESLRGLGVGIHLDDFGTGYSSISVLRDLPVTGVKLDLRFVHDLTTGPSQANALAQGLSGLVNGMNLTGIAEGIETEMQAHILRAQGWEHGQGYYFGRPAAMPISDQTTDGDLIA
jgi:diguanylate cyclase (GGDEF)-like protein/PAS domain S-box-containing protein